MRVLGALVALLACTACGAPRAQSPPEREWRANAAGVVQQLRRDVALAVREDAGTTLTDESLLYGAVVVYTDFGGCRHMVTALGVPPHGLGDVTQSLDRACVHLQRAALLFTRAVADLDPLQLSAATRAALRSAPLLHAAQLALRR